MSFLWMTLSELSAMIWRRKIMFNGSFHLGKTFCRSTCEIGNVQVRWALKCSFIRAALRICDKSIANKNEMKALRKKSLFFSDKIEGSLRILAIDVTTCYLWDSLLRTPLAESASTAGEYKTVSKTVVLETSAFLFLVSLAA